MAPKFKLFGGFVTTHPSTTTANTVPSTASTGSSSIPVKKTSSGKWEGGSDEKSGKGVKGAVVGFRSDYNHDEHDPLDSLINDYKELCERGQCLFKCFAWEVEKFFNHMKKCLSRI